MTDSTSATLLWFLGFFSLMLAWSVAEWLIRAVWRSGRVRRYLRRIRQAETVIDRSKYALRHTLRGSR